MASHPIYQFFCQLADYKPKIWRRYQTLDNITMARLGYQVMTLFEMQASHLFCVDMPLRRDRPRLDANDLPYVFDASDNMRFELHLPDLYEPDPDREKNSYEADKIPLHRVTDTEGMQFVVTYDYGDNWRVLMTIERVFTDKDIPWTEFPRVMDGAGYGIIEDCGGTSGLEDIAYYCKRKTSKKYKEYCEWQGVNEIDLTAFDIDDMNMRLKKVPRIYAAIYEKRQGPSKKAMAFLDREYKKISKKETKG